MHQVPKMDANQPDKSGLSPDDFEMATARDDLTDAPSEYEGYDSLLQRLEKDFGITPVHYNYLNSGLSQGMMPGAPGQPRFINTYIAANANAGAL